MYYFPSYAKSKDSVSFNFVYPQSPNTFYMIGTEYFEWINEFWHYPIKAGNKNA